MFDKFKDEILSAVDKYGENKIDIMINEETGDIYGMYHSKKNSFCITKDYPKEMASKETLIQFCDQINIGHPF